MDDPSVRRVGAFASSGVAIAYLLTGIFAVSLPVELQGRPDVTPHQFWTVLAVHVVAGLALDASAIGGLTS
jgi:hypothetical protein